MNIRVENYRNVSAGNTFGFADVTFDGVITVSDVRLINGKNGPFAAMPSRKEKDGKYHDTVRISSRELRDELTDALLRAADGVYDDENWEQEEQ